MEKYFFREFYFHTALNLGQALRDIRLFYYSPQISKRYPESSAKHFIYSILFRAKSFANNIFYSLLPPHLHHSSSELQAMRVGSFKKWFLHGFAPWRFNQPE